MQLDIKIFWIILTMIFQILSKLVEMSARSFIALNALHVMIYLVICQKMESLQRVCSDKAIMFTTDDLAIHIFFLI